MKKIILLLFSILLFTGCQTDSIDDSMEFQKNQEALKKSSHKIDVCHKGKMINISLNAVSAHQAHGDAVDMDGDGYFDLENECMDSVDCDDTDPEVNPSADEICGDGIDNNCNGEIDENCDDPCLDEAINQVSVLIQGLGGTNLSTTITSSNTFLISWTSGRDGRACIETTAEATGDPETGCGYTNLHHETVDCP